MKVVILAGGFGTRISEESHLKPKPMIEIGDMPILWHIMKIYSSYGYKEFIICCGYKANIIKEFFALYYLHSSDITFDFSNGNKSTIHNNIAEDWKVTLVDTGLNTMTGGRIKRVRQYIGNETFMMTYGDGVADIDVHKLVDFHRSHGKTLTLTTVNASQRFGVIDIGKDNSIRAFREKSNYDASKINGGFMVMEPAIFDYIDGDETVFEKKPLEILAAQGQLMAYQHDGFWQCMDTQRDKLTLEEMWNTNKACWKVW
ncbi:MAG TPA: glucose-1-phosphate cytidylyltransferase [Ruminococcaceae bacterium]|jgi:glucose-1-phosphate cytidylyltransferase|nr:glucose-1-phosphate cytidylyltransferase [Oscillospiraceae bacterium]